MEKKQQGRMTEEEIATQEREKAQLRMLIGDRATSSGANVDGEGALDPRFNLADQDHEYAIDPTHKEYRKVAQGHNKIMAQPHSHTNKRSKR